MTSGPPPTDHAYGPHKLQWTAVWKPGGKHDGTDAEHYRFFPEQHRQQQQNKFWLIYIHGGAWRDPRIDAKSFQPSVDQLFKTYPDLVSSSVAGLASINYRLSPHPDFPQDPLTTPRDEYRNAHHPDHVQDIRAALAMLQEKYGFGARYILLGHSCGATLALQVLAGLAAAAAAATGVEVDVDGRKDEVLLPPRAVVGIEGIYHFRGLVERLGSGYAPIFEVPFGPDQDAWDKASPALFEDWEGHNESIVLAWSPEDELVDGEELKLMARSLAKAGVPCSQFKELKGTHDGVWKSGCEIAALSASTLKDIALLNGN